MSISKKLVVMAVLMAVTGVLAFGAVNPTLAKTSEGALSAASTSGLSAEEADALLYMREEEKLAHDVYAVLYARWGLPVFGNISRSEQTHTEAVKILIDRYGLQDPASGTVGVFTNPDLQALYDELTARGEQSLEEALIVGATVEETDILDLEERISQADQADIQRVFSNLLKGSQNHLRAFVLNLSAQTGETYQPQVLDAGAYQEIISAGNQSGGSARGVRGYRGGRP